jgi:hypothetical protein
MLELLKDMGLATSATAQRLPMLRRKRRDLIPAYLKTLLELPVCT